ncbi:MAG: hypothetical protein N2167_02055 [Flavobacteriales bacterium]|nr:hypothetical protein [Flavobacteriales bacterium]
MKNKLIFILVIAISLISISTFTSFSHDSVNKCTLVVQDIQFKVINDTQADFSYAVNGVHKTIPKGQSVGFSYPENTVIHKWNNGQPGAVWFTVKAAMHGHSYQLSALLNN